MKAVFEYGKLKIIAESEQEVSGILYYFPKAHSGPVEASVSFDLSIAGPDPRDRLHLSGGPLMRDE